MTYAALPISHFLHARQYAVRAAWDCANPFPGCRGRAISSPIPNADRIRPTRSRHCFTPLRSRIADSSANSKISKQIPDINPAECSRYGRVGANEFFGKNTAFTCDGKRGVAAHLQISSELRGSGADESRGSGCVSSLSRACSISRHAVGTGTPNSPSAHSEVSSVAGEPSHRPVSP